MHVSVRHGIRTCVYDQSRVSSHANGDLRFWRLYGMRERETTLRPSKDASIDSDPTTKPRLTHPCFLDSPHGFRTTVLELSYLTEFSRSFVREYSASLLKPRYQDRPRSMHIDEQVWDINETLNSRIELICETWGWIKSRYTVKIKWYFWSRKDSIV